jgi:hypothetical protein
MEEKEMRKQLTIPGQEFLAASDPPTTRSSSTLDVLEGPAPQVDCLLVIPIAFSLNGDGVGLANVVIG